LTFLRRPEVPGFWPGCGLVLTVRMEADLGVSGGCGRGGRRERRERGVSRRARVAAPSCWQGVLHSHVD
jgi:hypothetical protein